MNTLYFMKISRTSSIMGIAVSWSRSQWDFKFFPFTTIQTVRSYNSTLVEAGKLIALERYSKDPGSSPGGDACFSHQYNYIIYGNNNVLKGT